MRYLILILLFPFALSSQVVDFTLTDGSSLGVSVSDIKFVIDGDGEYTVRYSEALYTANVTGHISTLADNYCLILGEFTSGGDSLLVNKDFVSRVFDDNNGGSVLLTKRFRYSFQVSESYAAAVSALSDGCESWPENNTYYISEGGDDAIAVKNNPRFPWATNAVFAEDPTKGSTFVFMPGTYNIDTVGTGEFTEWAPVLKTSTILTTAAAKIELMPGVNIRNEVISTGAGHSIWDDYDEARDIEIYAPNSTMWIDNPWRRNQFIHFVNSASVFKGTFDRLTGLNTDRQTNAYSELFSFGASEVDFTANVVDYTASSIGLVWIDFPDDAEHSIYVKDWYHRDDSLINSEQVPLYLYGSNVAGEVDNYNFHAKFDKVVIDETNASAVSTSFSTPSGYFLRMFNNGGSRNLFNDSDIEFDFGSITVVDPKQVYWTTVNTAAGGLFNYNYNGNTDFIWFQNPDFDDVDVKISVDYADISSKAVFTKIDGTIKGNSQIELDYGTIIGGRVIVVIRGSYTTGTVVKIHCDYCYTQDAVAFGMDGNFDATTTLEVSGTWVTGLTGAPAMVFSDAGAGTIILKDLTVINDGTVAAIQADVAQTIIVSGAYDGNTVILDPDITFTKNNY